jgi:hypothetical protein
MLFMELVCMLFCCLPYALLFILHEAVIYDIVNVTPCQGIGLSRWRNSLWYLIRLSEKEHNPCSLWGISIIEKGTWTLISLPLLLPLIGEQWELGGYGKVQAAASGWSVWPWPGVGKRQWRGRGWARGGIFWEGGQVWRVDYKKPMRTGHKQGKMQLSCFS